MRDRIGRRGGVDEHDRRSSLQLREDGIESAVAQVAAVGICHQRDPVELEHVQGVGHLFKRPFHIRKRQDRECSEPVRTVVFDAGEVFVDLAGKGPGRRIVTEVHPWRADRRNPDVDPGLIEV